MSETFDRGGAHITGLKIGRVTHLRNWLVLPGEKLDVSLSGFVNLQPLREQHALPIKIGVALFAAPVRWYEPYFEQLIRLKQGAASSYSMLALQFFAQNPDCLGLGRIEAMPMVWRAWVDFIDAIYNFWFKWPAHADSLQQVWKTSADICQYGRPVVNDDSVLTRLLDSTLADERNSTQPFDVASGRVDVDVLQLALRSVLYSRDIDEILGGKRYREIHSQLFRGMKGSAEVEKHPMLIDQHDQYMSGDDVFGTGSDNLGSRGGVMDFQVSHRCPAFKADEEHMLLSLCLYSKLRPTYHDHHDYFADPRGMSWDVMLGDGQSVTKRGLVDVNKEEVVNSQTTGTIRLGSLPAGWQWRSGFDHVGRGIVSNGAFLLMAPSDDRVMHPNVGNAFTSRVFGDAFAHLKIGARSTGSPIGSQEGSAHGSQS